MGNKNTGCGGNYKAQVLECNPHYKNENTYSTDYVYLYENGIIYAEIIEAIGHTGNDMISIKAKRISTNKYIDGQEIDIHFPNGLNKKNND